MAYRSVCGKCGALRVDKQIGLEQTPAEYVARLVAVFREVRRTLRADGACWVNLGDTYAGLKGNNRGEGAGGGQARGEIVFGGAIGGNRTPEGLKPKDMLGIPWMVAFALREAGWYLRSDIPWVKRAAMPESVTDRPAKALEYVFLLSKSAKYHFDMDAIKMTAAYAGTDRGGSTNRYEQNSAGVDCKQYYTRNFRNADLWFQSVDTPHGLTVYNDELVGLDVNQASCKDAHFATFPPKLIEPFILAGCPKDCCPVCGAGWQNVTEKDRYEPPVVEVGVRNVDASRQDKTRKLDGKSAAWRESAASKRSLGYQPSCDCGAEYSVPGLVLDPFTGSGTTGAVAISKGRNFVGIELNPEYVKLAERRIQQAVDEQATPLFDDIFDNSTP